MWLRRIVNVLLFSYEMSLVTFSAIPYKHVHWQLDMARKIYCNQTWTNYKNMGYAHFWTKKDFPQYINLDYG